MSLVIPSSLSASLSGIELDYSTYSTSSTQLVRTGLYIEANTPNPVPHISMFPYATGTFGAAQLAQGDLFVEGANLKFFDGTNINTILSSGSGGSITVANISTGLQVQNGNIYGDTNATLSIDSTVVQNNIINTFTQPQIFNSSISASTLYLTDTAYNFAGNVPVYSRTSSNSANLAPGWYSIAITPNNSVQGRTAAWVTFTTRGGNQAPNSQLYYVQKDWANLGNITLLSALSNNSFTSQIRLVWISGSSPTPGATRLDIYIPSPETSSIAYVTVQPDTSQQIIMTATTFTALPELSVSESVIAIMSSSGMYAGMSVTGVTSELYKYTTSGYILNTTMLMDDTSNIGAATSQRPANIYVLNTVSASSLQAGQISGSFFVGDGTQIINIVSSSYAQSASFATTASAATSITFVPVNANTSSYARDLISLDNRIISSSEYTTADLHFGFTAWGNDNVSPYADYIHLKSYSDSTGGGDNLLLFKKTSNTTAPGIRLRVGGFNNSGYSGSTNYYDVILTDNASTQVTLPGNLVGTIITGSVVGANEFVAVGGTSAGDTVFDMSQGYVWYSDNVGAGGANNRVWLNTPDRGELVLGPRAGAAFLDQMRLRSRRFTFEGDLTTGSGAGTSVVSIDNSLQLTVGTQGMTTTGPVTASALTATSVNATTVTATSVSATSVTGSVVYATSTFSGSQLIIDDQVGVAGVINSGSIQVFRNPSNAAQILIKQPQRGNARSIALGGLYSNGGLTLAMNAYQTGSGDYWEAGRTVDANALLYKQDLVSDYHAWYSANNTLVPCGSFASYWGNPQMTLDTNNKLSVAGAILGTTVTASTGFSGDGSQITGVVSSSYALSGSYTLAALSSSYSSNADNLDNQTGAFYQNASNINAGTIGNSFLPTAIGTVNTTYLGKLATLGNGGVSSAGLNLSGSSIVFNNSMVVGGWARGVTWMEPSVLTYSPGAGTFFEVGVLGSTGTSIRGYIGYGNAPYNNYFFGFDSASLTTLVGRPINASTTFISASTFSGSYSGSAATLTNAFLTHISGTDATWTGDISIGSLGVFDHTSAPQNNYLLGFNGTTRKWTSRPVQLAVGSGIAGASSLGDGTVIVYTNSNPTLTGTGTPATPSAPVVTTKYLAFTVDMSGTPLSTTQTQTYVVQYAVNGGSYGALLTTNAPKFVHSNLVSGSTYSYKYAVLNATATSSFSTPSAFMSASNTPVNDVFGIINADQISVAQLSAITGDIGTLTAGRIQNSSSTAGINFSGVVSSSWIRYIDFTATGSQVFWYMAPDTGSFIISVTSDGQASFQGNVFSPLVSASVVKSVTRIATPALYLNVSSSAILTASQIVATGNSLIAYGISAGSASVNQGGAGPLASATGSSIILGQYTRPSGTLTPETGTPGISSVSATTVVAGTIARTSINSTNTLLNTSPGMPAYDGNYTYNIEYSASAPQNASGYTNTLFIVAARTLYQSASHGFTSPWSVVATETLSLGDSLQGVAPYVANTPAGIIDSVQIETSGSIIVNASKILTGQATIETSYQTPISWNSGSVITHYRNGLYINKQEVSGTHYRLPHMTLEPLYDVPSGTAGMPGDICFVSGTHTGSAIVGMFMHDGSRWRQFAFI